MNPQSKLVAENDVFYIVAPKYNRQSAGIIVLHQLCHLINETKGLGNAFILYYPNVFPVKNYTNPKLNTPLLSQADLKKHKNKSLNAIAIYPEVVWGNPYHVNQVVRYLLNFVGLLGGPSSFPITDFVMSWSEEVYKSYSQSQCQLLIPVFNKDIFWFLGNEMRDITCYYGSKYQILGGKIFGLPKDCIEITRGKKNSLSQQEIGNLLRRSKALYVFENSNLINEAILCGCPVVLMFNEHFQKVFGKESFSLDGTVLSDAPDELEKASLAITRLKENGTYEQVEKKMYSQLNYFMEKVEEFPFNKDQGFSFRHPLYSKFKWLYILLYLPAYHAIRISSILCLGRERTRRIHSWIKNKMVEK